MIQKIEATNVLKKLIKAESSGYTVIKLQGGSRSSKSWSIMQFFLFKALAGEVFDVTITRAYLSLVKDTLLRDFEDMLELYNITVTPDINRNRPDQQYKILNATFLFWGLDKPKKAHGKKQVYTWINEAIEIEDKKVFDQLEMRTEKLVILDYNPSDDSHWVFGLDKRDDVFMFTSTQLDNPFLPVKIRDKILGYEPTAYNILQGTADNYMWEVYGLGKPAKLEGAIFTNWDIVESIPEDAKSLGLGMDFGFSNDPASLIELFMYNQELYVNELIYTRELVNISPEEGTDTLSKRMKDLGIGDMEITADLADPKSIKELRNEGFNIHGGAKGDDSIRYGINLMKGYKIHITRRSINIESEFRKYKWAVDRNGNPLKKPVDAYNHAIDSIRYRVMKVLGNNYNTEISDNFL